MNMGDPQPDAINRSVSLSDQATTILRNRIAEGVYPPGHRLVEVELAASLGISRGPLREALRSLVQEGIIIHFSNKGFHVPPITLADAQGLYELREAIETAAARWAAERATEAEIGLMAGLLDQTLKLITHGKTVTYPMDLDFHVSVIQAAHSPLIEKRARETHHQLRALRRGSAGSHEAAQIAYEEHRAIADAVARKDVVGAEQAMRFHQENSRERGLAAIRRYLKMG
jgi:DNA-binding GntR family transcriptional regulator